MNIPTPYRLNGCTRWRLSELESAEAALTGDLEANNRKPVDDRYLSVKQVAARYSVSIPTVWRWSQPEQGITA